MDTATGTENETENPLEFAPSPLAGVAGAVRVKEPIELRGPVSSSPLAGVAGAVVGEPTEDLELLNTLQRAQDYLDFSPAKPQAAPSEPPRSPGGAKLIPWDQLTKTPQFAEQSGFQKFQGLRGYYNALRDELQTQGQLNPDSEKRISEWYDREASALGFEHKPGWLNMLEGPLGIVSGGKLSTRDAALSAVGGVLGLADTALALDQISMGVVPPELYKIGASLIGEGRDKLESLKSRRAIEARLDQQHEVAKAEGFWDELFTAAKTTATDPDLIIGFVAEQLPMLIGTGGVGTAARGVVSTVGKRLLGRSISEATLGRVSLNAARAAGAMMHGGDAVAGQLQEIHEALGKMTPEELNAIPGLKERLDAGMPLEDAKADYAESVAQKTFVAAGGVAFLSQFIPGASTLEKGVLSLFSKGGKEVATEAVDQARKALTSTQTFRKALGAGISAGTGEAISESIFEEGTGQAIANYTGREVFPDRSILEGVGQAAGQALVPSAIMGGVAGASQSFASNSRHAAVMKMIHESAPNVPEAELGRALVDIDRKLQDPTTPEEERQLLQDMQRAIEESAEVQAAQRAVEELRYRDAPRVVLPENFGESDLTSVGETEGDLLQDFSIEKTPVDPVQEPVAQEEETTASEISEADTTEAGEQPATLPPANLTEEGAAPQLSTAEVLARINEFSREELSEIAPSVEDPAARRAIQQRMIELIDAEESLGEPVQRGRDLSQTLAGLTEQDLAKITEWENMVAWSLSNEIGGSPQAAMDRFGPEINRVVERQYLGYKESGDSRITSNNLSGTVMKRMAIDVLRSSAAQQGLRTASVDAELDGGGTLMDGISQRQALTEAESTPTPLSEELQRAVEYVSRGVSPADEPIWDYVLGEMGALADYEKTSQQELAESLGMSVRTVNNRVAELKQMVAEELSERFNQPLELTQRAVDAAMKPRGRATQDLAESRASVKSGRENLFDSLREKRQEGMLSASDFSDSMDALAALPADDLALNTSGVLAETQMYVDRINEDTESEDVAPAIRAIIEKYRVQKEQSNDALLISENLNSRTDAERSAVQTAVDSTPPHLKANARAVVINSTSATPTVEVVNDVAKVSENPGEVVVPKTTVPRAPDATVPPVSLPKSGGAQSPTRENLEALAASIAAELMGESIATVQGEAQPRETERVARETTPAQNRSTREQVETDESALSPNDVETLRTMQRLKKASGMKRPSRNNEAGALDLSGVIDTEAMKAFVSSLLDRAKRGVEKFVDAVADLRTKLGSIVDDFLPYLQAAWTAVKSYYPNVDNAYETNTTTSDSVTTPSRTGTGTRPAVRVSGGVPSGSGPTTRIAKRIVPARAYPPGGAGQPRLDGGVSRYLTEDQKYGATAAINSLERDGAFLLADGAGLGKTRQLLAVADYYAQRGFPVIYLSQNNAIKPDWKTGGVSGTLATDADIMGIPLTLSRKGEAVPGKVTVTTYHAGNLENAAEGITPDTVVILDEAHTAKSAADEYSTGSKIANVVNAISARAGKVLYATATPAEKHNHLEYLTKLGLADNMSTDQLFEFLGMSLKKAPGGREYWVQGVTDAELTRRIGKLFSKIYREGRMVKRDIALDGVSMNISPVVLSEDAKSEMDDIFYHYGGDEAQGKTRGQQVLAMRMHQEKYKVEETVRQAADWVKTNPKGKVVVFANLVNGATMGGVESGSSVDGVIEGLKESGAVVEEMTGRNSPAHAAVMERFQTGDTQVLVTTIQSGGTGINLDDRSPEGDQPRLAIFMTPPLSSLDTIQGVGRVWRLATNSYPTVSFVVSDHPIDQWNAQLISRKLKLLGATIEGQTSSFNLREMEDDANIFGEPETGATTPAEGSALNAAPTHFRSEEGARSVWSVGGNLGSALREVGSRSPNRHYRIVAGWLEQMFGGTAAQVEVVPTSSDRADGAYNPDKDSISLDRNLWDVDLDYTVLHEAVHAALFRVIRDFQINEGRNLSEQQRRAVAQLDSQRSELLQRLVDAYPPNTLDQFQMELGEAMTYSEQLAAFERQAARFPSQLQQGLWRNFYGLVNLQEFASEILTNPELMEFASTIPAGTTPASGGVAGRVLSVLSRIKDALYQMFGVSRGSALDRSISASQVLFKSGRLRNGGDGDVSLSALRRHKGADFQIGRGRGEFANNLYEAFAEYTPTSWDESIGRAQEVLQEYYDRGAWDTLLNELTSGELRENLDPLVYHPILTQAREGALRSRQSAMNRGDWAEAESLDNVIAQLVSQDLQFQKTAGQIVSQFRAARQLDPSGILIQYKKEVQKLQDAGMSSETKDTVKDITSQLAKVNEEGADTVVAGTQKLIDTVNATAGARTEARRKTRNFWNAFKERFNEDTVREIEERFRTTHPLPDAQTDEDILKVFLNQLRVGLTARRNQALPEARIKTLATELDRVETLRQLLRGVGLARDAWNDARKEVRKRWSGSKESLAQLEKFLDNELDLPFAGSQLSAALKEQGVTVNQLARMSPQEREEFLAPFYRLISEGNRAREEQVRRGVTELLDNYLRNSDLRARVSEVRAEMNALGITTKATATTDAQKEALARFQNTLETLTREEGTLDQQNKELKRRILEEFPNNPRVQTFLDTRAESLVKIRDAQYYAEANGVDLAKLVREHYSKVNATGFDLAEKLVSQFALPKETADRVAKAYETAFARATARRKKLIRDAAIKKAKESKDSKVKKNATPIVDRLVEMSNLGVFADQDYYEAVASSIGLPTYRADIAQKLYNLAEQLQTEDVGFRKRDIRDQIQKELDRARGFSMLDLWASRTYNNYLSGLSTMAKVFGLSSVNQVFTVGTSVIGNNPTQALAATKKFLSGMRRGWDEAKTIYQFNRETVDFRRMDIMTRSDGFEAIDFLDPDDIAAITFFGKPVFTGTNAQRIANFNQAIRENTGLSVNQFYRFTIRNIKALSGLTAHGTREAMFHLAAIDEATKNPTLNGADLGERVAELLGESEALQAKFEAQAINEGITNPSLVKLRVYELMDAHRASTLGSDAEKYATELAARGALDNEPTGPMINAIYSGIRNVFDTFERSEHGSVRALGTIVRVKFFPFTRIALTSIDAMLNYTPFAAWTIAKEPDPRIRQMMKVQMVAGTVGAAAITLAALAAMAGADEGEEPWFTFYGKGPSERWKREQMPRGWVPYSIKVGDTYIPYNEHPMLATPLALIGNIWDGLRYDNLSEKEGAQIAMYGAQLTISSLVDRNVFTGINDLSGLLQGDERTINQFIPRQIAAEVPGGNLTRQIEGLISGREFRSNPDSFVGNLFSQVPVVRKFAGLPEVNALGDEVGGRNPLSYLVSNTPDRVDDKVYTLLAQKDAFVRPPEKKVVFHGASMGKSFMTEQQRRDYVVLSGQHIKQYLLDNHDRMAALDQPAFHAELEEVVKQFRKAAKNEVLAREIRAGNLK